VGGGGSSGIYRVYSLRTAKKPGREKKKRAEVRNRDAENHDDCPNGNVRIVRCLAGIGYLGRAVPMGRTVV